MNGIFEWRNEAEFGSYPLAGSISDNDLLVDAQFICFDNSIPVLKSYKVEAGLVSLTINIEGKDAVVELTSAAVSGTEIPLLLSRYFGFLVVGPGVVRLLKESVGKVVVSKTKFDVNTVVSMPSTSGVFSIDGMYGDVELKTSEHVQLSAASHTVTFNSVAVPSKQLSVTLVNSPNLVYAVTSTKKLLEINVTTGAYTVLADLDQSYKAIAVKQDGSVIYGVAGTTLFDLSTMPATPVMTLVNVVNGLHFTPNGNLYGAGQKVVLIDPTVQTEVVLATLNALDICTGDVTQGSTDSKLYMTIAGVRKRALIGGGPAYSQVYTADRLLEYDLNSNTVSSIRDIWVDVPPSSKHDATGVYALTNTPLQLFGWTLFIDAGVSLTTDLALNINATTGKAVHASVVHDDALVGRVFGSTRGWNAKMMINNLTALKSVNGVTANSNSLIIEDSALIKVTQTGDGELTIGLPDITGLQIARSKKFA